MEIARELDLAIGELELDLPEANPDAANETCNQYFYCIPPSA
ncbi:hypothetical protein AB0P21_26515 [Kribbella sp. NPDC056861]